MQVGSVQKIIAIFTQAFQQLGVDVPLEKVEELAVTIHRAMTVHARHFHTLDHVFMFIEPDYPVRTLAALYHDIVYFQVDMGFSPQIWELISPYIQQKNGEFYVADTFDPADRNASLALDIFNLQSGQKLTSVAALNEFLSALVMIKQLTGLVPEKELFLMTLCIEATIPFRKLDADGRNHFYVIEDRLPELAKKYELELSHEELAAAIKLAVGFANKDIENFAEADPGKFLDNTWKLLPETNAALRLPDVYSIGTYRQALRKMEGFFADLNPDAVFSQYRGVPEDAEYTRMLAHAYKNIIVARQYLKIKILAVTILEALAIATGGDAPLSLFMGDLPREGVSIKRLEYFLPELSDPTWVDRNSAIYNLLESGRASETSFDMKNAPLTLFVYKSLSPEAIDNYLTRAKLMHDGTITAQQFLEEMERPVVAAIAQASAVMVFTRRQLLLRYAS